MFAAVLLPAVQLRFTVFGSEVTARGTFVGGVVSVLSGALVAVSLLYRLSQSSMHRNEIAIN